MTTIQMPHDLTGKTIARVAMLSVPKSGFALQTTDGDIAIVTVSNAYGIPTWDFEEMTDDIRQDLELAGWPNVSDQATASTRP